MRFFLTIAVVHLFSFISFCQASRKNIIDHKIKVTTEVIYNVSNGTKKKENKTYYTRTGDDSIKIVNGHKFYVFRTTNDRDAELNLVADYKGKDIGEIQYIKYYADSTYSIEILDVEDGNSRYYKYNSKHECLFVITKSGDTVFNHYDAEGNLKKTTINSTKSQTVFEIAEKDSAGNATRVNYNIGRSLKGYSTYRFNDKGLREEVRQYAVQAEGDLYMSKSTFTYEYWE